jgi:hypothetical protein
MSCCSRGAVTIGLPPAWVDVSEEISANTQRARTKMTELAKAHAKALMPSFGDARDDQRPIEVLTHEITDLLKSSEKKLQKLSMKDASEDSNVRKNVQVVIRHLVYLKQLKRVTIFKHGLNALLPVFCSDHLLQTCKTSQWSSVKSSRLI